jgi:hypothetical protein
MEEGMKALLFALMLAVALISALVAGAAMGLMAWLLLASPAQSHSWYDAACCNEQDCRVIDASSVTYDAANRVYLWRSDLSGKTHVFHEDNISSVDGKPKVRISRDAQYHGCERNTADRPGSSEIWVGYCLYLPATS